MERLQNSSSKILKRWNNKNWLDRKYKDIELTLTDTQMAKFYGLVKLHKQDHPLRPVVSLVNYPTERIAKQLYKVLYNCFPLPLSHIKNAEVLRKEIINLRVPEDHILLSLDVVSLYTNVSKRLVLASLKKRKSIIKSHSIISYNEIEKATQYLFDNIYFKFNDHIFHQQRGTPMVSSISGLYADIVMEDHEKECLKKLSFTPLLYKRYVDDILTIIPRSKISEVLQVFNETESN